MPCGDERKAAVSDSERSSPSLSGPIEVYLDGEVTPSQVLQGPPYHLDLDTSTLPNGPHVLRLARIDAAGVRHEQTMAFTVENKTVFDVAGLEPGSRVSGTVAIDVTPYVPSQAPADQPMPAAALRGPSPWLYLGVTAVVFLAIWLFFVLVPSYSAWVGTGGSAEASAADATLMSVGESVYTTSCAACHKPDGVGMGTAIPALAGNPAVADADAVMKIIAHGSETMMAFSQLDAQQVAAVATYIRNSWGNAYGNASVDDAATIVGGGAATTPAAEAAPEQAETAAAEAAPAATTPAAGFRFRNRISPPRCAGYRSKQFQILTYRPDNRFSSQPPELSRAGYKKE